MDKRFAKIFISLESNEEQKFNSVESADEDNEGKGKGMI
jgi:hypothetical protein